MTTTTPMRAGHGLAYGLLGLPLAFVALPLYVLLPNHYAREFGMPLATLGAVLLAARLFDAFTDPLLGRHGGLLRRRGDAPRPGSWWGADVVLISHLHHDHAELRSLRLLDGLPVLTGPANAEWLRGKGVSGVGLDEGWHRVSDRLAVRLARADHHSRPMPYRPNEAHGHLLRADDSLVWVAGDTSLYDDMADLPALGGTDHVDLAFVPIGGWGPRLSPGHLGPEEAAEACSRARVRWVVPVHWGTFHPPTMKRWGAWMDRPAVHFREALRRTAPECQVLELVPGASGRVPLERLDG